MIEGCGGVLGVARVTCVASGCVGEVCCECVRVSHVLLALYQVFSGTEGAGVGCC